MNITLLKKSELGHAGSIFFITLIFASITASEYIFAFRDVSYGIVLSLLITLCIYIIISIFDVGRNFTRSAESLALIPLYVLFTASLPWFFIDQQFLLPAVYSIILALCFWHVYEHDIDLKGLGFIKDKALKYSIIGILLGVPTGVIEYLILMPAPSFPSIEPFNLLRDVIYMLLFVGVAEEMLFRGIIQSDLSRVFGWHKAIVAQGFLFGVLHMTWRSSYEIAFTFFAGILLGYYYYRTKSLVGPIIWHGVNNVILVSVMPYIYPGILSWFS